MDRTPFIDSDDVALYPLEEEDLARIQDIVNHKDVWHWISINTPQNMSDEQAFFDRVTDDDDTITFVVFDKGEEQIQGTIGLRIKDHVSRVADFGISLDPEHHSKGIGKAAATLLFDYGFDQLNLHRIMARADAANEKSVGLMHSLGMTEEGRMREHVFNDGAHHDMLVFGILASEWRAK